MIHPAAVPPLRRAAFRLGGLLLWASPACIAYIGLRGLWLFASRAAAYFQSLGVPPR
jgi:hypothetical protein